MAYVKQNILHQVESFNGTGFQNEGHDKGREPTVSWVHSTCLAASDPSASCPTDNSSPSLGWRCPHAESTQSLSSSGDLYEI